MRWGERRRSSLEIIASILDVLENGGQSKTAIMHKANLNFKRVNIYISFLLSKGFISIEKRANSKKYLITRRGLELLKDYRDLIENEKKLIEILRKLECSISL